MSNQSRWHRTWLAVLLPLLAGAVLMPALSCAQGKRPPVLPTAAERIAAWKQANPGQPLPASVKFDRLLTTGQVDALVRQSGVAPYAVYMWSEGMTGIHRVDRSKARPGVVAEARQRTLEMKEQALVSIAFRAKLFVTANPREKVESQGELASDARSLLIRRDQNEKMLTAVRRGAPMIYGLEVVGTEQQLAALVASPSVAGWEPAAILKWGRVAVPHPKPPAEAGRRFRAEAIESLTPGEAYSRLQQMQEGAANAPGGAR